MGDDHRLGDGDVGRVRIDESSESPSGGLDLRDPGIPVHPLLVPGSEVTPGRLPHAVQKGAA